MATDEQGHRDVIPTVTLAKLYEKQGLLAEAAAVYRKLIEAEPGQEVLENALRNIEGNLQRQKPRTASTETKTVLSQLEQWLQVVRSRKKAVGQHGVKKAKVLVIHGLDAEGLTVPREEVGSGSAVLEEFVSHIKGAAERSGIIADIFWAKDEEALAERVRAATRGYAVLIISPGQSQCTGPVVREALAALDIPIIEVHALNAFRRERSRESGIAHLTTAHLAGFGKEGYAMAVRAAAQMARESIEAKA